MATTDQMLRAVHGANPKAMNQRYNPQQLQAAFAALKKPKAPAQQTPGQQNPAQQNPDQQQTFTTGQVQQEATNTIGQNIQNSGMDQKFDSGGALKEGSLSGVNTNESNSTQSAIDAAFGQLTQNTDKEYSRDKQNLEQQLANRGIPYSNDPNSQYQQQMGDLNNRYDQVRADAKQKAVLTGYNQYNKEFENQELGRVNTSQINQGDATINNQNLSTMNDIQNTLVQQGFDKQKINAIFKQLALDKQKVNLMGRSSGSSGGQQQVTAVDDPFGA